jgi:hypothetical protein
MRANLWGLLFPLLDRERRGVALKILAYIQPHVWAESRYHRIEFFMPFSPFLPVLFLFSSFRSLLQFLCGKAPAHTLALRLGLGFGFGFGFGFGLGLRCRLRVLLQHITCHSDVEGQTRSARNLRALRVKVKIWIKKLVPAGFVHEILADRRIWILTTTAVMLGHEIPPHGDVEDVPLQFNGVRSIANVFESISDGVKTQSHRVFGLLDCRLIHERQKIRACCTQEENTHIVEEFELPVDLLALRSLRFG